MNKDLKDGTTLSHYRIERKIGAGGMGEVFLAEDTRLRRKLALKVLPENIASDKERLRRFEQEAFAASALNHPNILTIYEFGAAGETHFLACEFVEGETLREKLNREDVSLDEALAIAQQIAFALSAAHSAGIAHRDIKPENIMIRSDGIVKVLDFGLAKLIGFGIADLGLRNEEAETLMQEPSNDPKSQIPNPKLTSPGMIMGTISYMSPEQARGKNVDTRTDIWSLGVLLYEMLARRLPFEGETPNEYIASILKSDPLPLENKKGEIPADLASIVRKALRKDKDARYQTMKGLLADLKELREEIALREKLERSVIPNRIHQKENRETLPTKAETTDNAGGRAQTVSSAEYIVSGIKRHKSFSLAAIAISLLAIIGIGGWFYSNRQASTDAKQIESIAVMPFVNESGNSDVEYLSDGMTETLINSLSLLPNVLVKARSTVFYYKGKEISPKKIGEELNVQAVLLGRVVQRGEDLKLSLELVNTRTQNVIWSESYNRRQAELVSLQSEIARDVSGKLKLKLSGADEQKLNKVYTTSPDAYQLYLKGRFYWNKLTPKDVRQSVEFYQQAIDKDPAFALAYVGISDTYMLLGIPDVMLGVIPPQESVRRARNAADKALEIDPTLAEAYASRAHVKWKERDWAGADEDFKHSIELNGNYSNARRFYAIYLASTGRSAEAVQEVRRAEELEPLSVSVKAHAAYIYYLARRYDEAVEAGKKAIELDAASPVAHQRLGAAYEQIGMLPEAIAEFQKAVDGSNRVQLAVTSLAHAFALAGKRAEAEKLLAELRERSGSEYVSSYLIAEVYAALGEKETAFKFLDQAYDERSIDLVLAKVDPRLDPLRGDPRFADLMRRVGFSQ